MISYVAFNDSNKILILVSYWKLEVKQDILSKKIEIKLKGLNAQKQIINSGIIDSKEIFCSVI